MNNRNIPMFKGMVRPELFLLPRETILALDADVVGETYQAMVDLGIAHLPYSCIDIGVTGHFLIGLDKIDSDGVQGMRFVFPVHNPSVEPDPFNDMPTSEVLKELGGEYDDYEVRFRYLNERPICGWLKYPDGSWSTMGVWSKQDDAEGRNQAGHALRKILIILLGTKNTIKTRVKDKLLSMGIGVKKNNHRPLYTTTITLPKPEHMEYEGVHAPGTSPRAHLRRGHKREQKYGPRLQFSKPIWIEPVFVNADENFVSSRTAYNTSTRTESP